MESGKRRSVITRPNDDDQTTCRFKLVLLGMSGAGKTSIMTRLLQNKFSETLSISVGAIFHTQTLNINDETIKLYIWDTAGQERFRALVPMYYRGANAALVVYDIQCRDSFQSAKDWVEILQEEASPNITVALVGNKTDFANKRTVSFKEAEKYAKEKQLLFMETSAKTGTNVADIFSAIAKKLLAEFDVIELKKRQREMNIIRLENEKANNKALYRCFATRACFK